MPSVDVTAVRSHFVRLSLKYRLLTMVLSVVCIAACSDTPPTGPAIPAVDRPQPGALLVQVSGVQPGDAAFQMELTGLRSTADLTVAPPLQMHVRQRGNVWHVALFGAPANGSVLRVQVPDVRDAARYTASVTDVAREDGALLGGDMLGVYRASFVRVP